MPFLNVQTPHARVCLRSERLLIHTPGDGTPELKSEVPLHDLDRVVFAENVQVSTSALCELLRRQISVTFLTWNALLLGSFEPPCPPRGACRLLQYRAVENPAVSLAIAKKLIHAKISNSRRLLQRLDANHHRLKPAIFDAMEARERDAFRAPDLASLRGSEGAAAAVFFEGWALFLPREFPFSRRSTRPPLNPVIACLSYLAAMVYGELLTACASRGLDPALGCLHQSNDSRWSLPLDLLEPFRPALVEPLTLRLFSHRILQNRRFESRAGGVWLNLEGRRTIIRHYEQRVQREFLSEHAGCRTSLRHQLKHAALQFKLALAQPEIYAPFRIN